MPDAAPRNRAKSKLAGSDVTYLQSAARADAKALHGMAEKA